MSKPYWERKAFQTFKQIKVLQPNMQTTVHEYMDVKIKEQEKNLVTSALALKKNLQSIDQLPHNGIMSDMVDTSKKEEYKSRGGAVGPITWNCNPSQSAS